MVEPEYRTLSHPILPILDEHLYGLFRGQSFQMFDVLEHLLCPENLGVPRTQLRVRSSDAVPILIRELHIVQPPSRSVSHSNIEIQRKLPRVRSEIDGLCLMGELVRYPRLDDIRSEHVSSQKVLVVPIQRFQCLPK